MLLAAPKIQINEVKTIEQDNRLHVCYNVAIDFGDTIFRGTVRSEDEIDSLIETELQNYGVK